MLLSRSHWWISCLFEEQLQKYFLSITEILSHSHLCQHLLHRPRLHDPDLHVDLYFISFNVIGRIYLGYIFNIVTLLLHPCFICIMPRNNGFYEFIVKVFIRKV